MKEIDMTPGWKTTEFWLTLIATALGALAASGILPDTLGGDHWLVRVAGIVMAVLSAYGYTARRSDLKRQAAENSRNDSGPPSVMTGLLLVFGLMFSGCASAGTAAEVLAFDNIQAAAVEAQKGVQAYDIAIKVEQARLRDATMNALTKDIATIAKATSMPADQAQTLATRITDAMRGHLDNFTEQERRRQALYEPTMDNLGFIVQVCDRARQFTLYRADVATQWKTYLETTAKAQLKRVDPTAATPSPVAPK